MDYEQAKYQLMLHGSGATDALGEPIILDDGFLASLRPYTGLHEKNFHLVMEALLTVGERIHRDSQVDRELVTSVWWMCSSARAWGLHPGGMLRRNNLITTADGARLEWWIDTIERTALGLLDGWPPHRAVTGYAEYIVAVGWWDNIGFFVPLLDRAASDSELVDALEIIVAALGKLGSIAKSVLPTLHEARSRSFTWYEPNDRCTQEMRARIQEAIQSIEYVVGESSRSITEDP